MRLLPYWSALVLVASLSLACETSKLPVPAEVTGGCGAEIVNALEHGDERAAKDLIARGAEVNCPRTAARLEEAIRDDRIEALALLLRVGVNPNRSAGEFPDHARSMSLALEEHLFRDRSLSATRLLLEHGANPDQRDNYSWNPVTRVTDDTGMPYTRYEVELREVTPLIVAVVAQDIALAMLLVEFGADVTARDASGKTALDYARASNNREITGLLERRVEPAPLKRAR